MLTLSRPGRSLACSMIALATLCVAARGAEAVKKEIDPKAQKVLDDFGKYFGGLRSFRMTAEVTLTVEQQGKKQENAFLQKFSAERPNKLTYLLESPQGGATVVSNGTDLSMAVNALGKYATEKAPATWQVLLQNPLVQGMLGFGNGLVVTGALLGDDPAKKLIEKSESLQYGGLVDLDGVQCHLISATGGEMDWQLWIEAGDRLLPRKFVPDLAKAFERIAKAQKGRSPLADAKVTDTITYSDWDVNPKFADDAFAFTAPEGTTKVKSLMDIVTGGRERAETGPHPLVGKPAPPINLELLDGGTLDLAALKGKKVVILDFWATWCGPCVQAMPVIDKVAEQFKSKGVELFAVNLEEMPDDVRKFLDDAELKVTVALDKEGTVARAYQAAAIPQTVLIGKDGSVQAVYVGVSPSLQEQLTKDLDGLVAGKNLAAATLAAAKKKAEEQAAEKADDEPDTAKEEKPASPKSEKKAPK